MEHPARFIRESTRQEFAEQFAFPDILEATSYDHNAGRKMLGRMCRAGELVSPARGLYTTANHPCLVHSTDDTSPVPNVPTVSTVPSSQSSTLANSPQSDMPAVRITDPTTSKIPSVPNVPTVSNPAHSTSEVAQQHIDTTSPAPLEMPPKGNGTS